LCEDGGKSIAQSYKGGFPVGQERWKARRNSIKKKKKTERLTEAGREMKAADQEGRFVRRGKGGKTPGLKKGPGIATRRNLQYGKKRG